MKFNFLKASVVLIIFLLVGCQAAKRKQMTRDRLFISTAYQFASETGEIPYDSIHLKKINKNQDSISFYKDKKLIHSVVIDYDL